MRGLEHVSNEVDHAVGTVIGLRDNLFCVQASDGVIGIRELQRPGGKLLEVDAFRL